MNCVIEVMILKIVHRSRKVDEKSAFVKEKELCFGCFKLMSASHNSRSCNERRTFKICGSRHPTSVHGYHPKHKEETLSNHTHPKVMKIVDLLSAEP